MTGPQVKTWLAALVLVLAALLPAVLLIEAAGAAEPTERWAQLADCETGGDWQSRIVVRQNGRRYVYEGGVHFDSRTWDAYRADDMPASAADAHVFAQVWVAEKVLDAETWRAWPSCSRKLGYRR